MIDEFYNVWIFEFVGNIEWIGWLDVFDVMVMCVSCLCGFKVMVDLKVENGVVVDFVYDVKVCVLG